MAKEVQRKSLLIAGGCSNTDPNWHAYVDNGIMTWSPIVAEFLNTELLCLGKSGMGNDYICNSITDAVLDNPDKDITVVTLWSGPGRLNLFDFYYYVFPLFDDAFASTNMIRELFKYEMKDISFFELDRKMVNFNLRCFWRLNTFLKERNIKHYQIHYKSVVNDVPWVLPYYANRVLTPEDKMFQFERQEKIMEYVTENRYFNKEYFTHHDWRHNFIVGDDESMQIPDDKHPNQKGHDYIASEFIRMMANE